MEFYVKENFAIWQYDAYVAVGVLGTLPGIEKLVLPDGEKEESSVMNKGQKQFRAVMYFSPPMDLTVIRFGDNECSLFAQGIDRKSVEKIILEIASPPFISQPPTRKFACELNSDVIMGANTFRWLTRLSAQTSIPLQRLWGAVKYSNFLKLYRAYSDSDSFNTAAKKFGIPLAIARGLN